MKIMEVDGVPIRDDSLVIGTILYCHKCKKSFKSNKNTVKVDGKYVCPKCLENENER